MATKAGDGGPTFRWYWHGAGLAGVDRLVCIGTDASTSAQAVAVARDVHDGGTALPAWASIGLHPHEATDRRGCSGQTPRATRAALVTASSSQSASAAWTTTTSTRRARCNGVAFAAQIALAHAHDLALVIHARDAWDDLFDVLAAEGVPERTDPALLHRRTRGTRSLPTRRHVRVVQRHHHLQERVGHSRGRGTLPARPLVGGNRQSIPGAGAPSGTSQRARARCPWSGRRWPTVKGCAVEAIAESTAAAAAAAFAISA